MSRVPALRGQPRPPEGTRSRHTLPQPASGCGPALPLVVSTVPDVADHQFLASTCRGRVLAELADILPRGILLLGRRSGVLYANRSARRLLEEAPDPERLLNAVNDLAARLWPLPSAPSSEQRARARDWCVIGAALYRLKAVRLEEPIGPDHPAAVVLVARRTEGGIPMQALRDKLGLTEREALISLLLSAGRTNPEIARILRISAHTVRHHVERVLRKLNVRSRAEVGPLLRRRTRALMD